MGIKSTRRIKLTLDGYSVSQARQLMDIGMKYLDKEPDVTPERKEKLKKFYEKLKEKA